MLDVGRLRILLAIARTGSVTAAAEALHYAQPSISHHLRKLEAECGTPLVQRVGRRVRLTPAGQLLADRAAEIVGRLDATERELAAHVGLRQGQVRLAAFPSALGTFVPAASVRLRRTHPGLELRLTEAEPPEALRMLRAGYVDVAVLFRYGEPEQCADLHETGLLEEPGHLITSKEQPTELGAYTDAEWISGCDRCREHLVAVCAEAGFEPRIGFGTDDYVAVQALVAAGIGVTILPGLALTAARNPDVVVTELPHATRQVYAATYGDPATAAPAATTLLDALTATTAARP